MQIAVYSKSMQYRMVIQQYSYVMISHRNAELCGAEMQSRNDIIKNRTDKWGLYIDIL